MNRTVLLTDRAWPDDSIERAVIEGSGRALVAGPPEPASAAEIEKLVAEHEPAAIMTCWAQVSAPAISTDANLRIVARLGVGLDNIAVPTATERGVLVTNVPDYCVEEVSDHAVGLVLSWARGIARTNAEVHDGRWAPAGARLRRVSSLTVGIVGFGRIGSLTAAKLQAFGARVIATRRRSVADSPVPVVGLDELLAASDVVILHAPLTDGTRHLLGAGQFALMRPGALLVNVSRGGLVDTAALIEALESGRLSGAGLDVLEHEPDVSPALLKHPGVVITPHIAFASGESVAEMRRRAAEEVVRVLDGHPAHHPCNVLPVPDFGAL